MLFSLARGGYAPKRFGELSARGAPVSALLVTAIGLAVAAVITKRDPSGAFVYFIGLTLFGMMFVWQMVFVTQIYFRRRWIAEGRTPPVRMPGYPYTSYLGLALVSAIILTTWWVDRMRITIISGLAWLGVITLGYWFWKRRFSASGAALAADAALAGPRPGAAP